MKKISIMTLSIFVLLLTLFMGCSESEQPLNENDELAVEDSALAPEVGTIILRGISATDLHHAQLRERRFQANARPRDGTIPSPFRLPHPNIKMVTNAGTPTTVYRWMDGHLQVQDIIFRKEYYHLEWFSMGDEIVLVNLISEKIPYLSVFDAIDIPTIDPKTGELTEVARARMDEIWAEEKKKFLDVVAAQGGVDVDPAIGWVDKDGQVIDLPDELRRDNRAEVRWEREFSIHPFRTGAYEDIVDEIECTLRYTHTYKYFDVEEMQVKERKMLFVKVLRNLTRPHITFPRPLF